MDLDTLGMARAYVAAGLSLLPIRRDGTKAPAPRLLPLVWDEGEHRDRPTWRPFMERLPTDEELLRWFGGAEPAGIALIGGIVSGNLEQIDFDRDAVEIFPAWRELVEAEAPGLFARLAIARTPREPAGFHVRYRTPGIFLPGNQDLAIDPTARGRERVLIQTRGEGGYAIAPGSPPACHPTGRTWEPHSGPTLPPEITAAEREVLLRCARSFTREAKEEAAPVLRPGEDFDQRGPDWGEILEPAGWRCVGHNGRERRWRRPDKDAPGWSATTGHCRGKDGADLLRVFSSNAAPFEDGKAYGKFRAWSLLHHAGNHAAAAKALAAQGFGQRGPVAAAATRNGHAVNGSAHNGHAENDRLPAEPLDIPLPPPEPWPEPPSAAAYHGVAGQIMAQIAPQTEADPIAILAQVLTCFGSVIGRHAHWRVEEDRHYGNLYCCLVGDTAVGRKGVSLGRALRCFEAVQDEWSRTRIYSGLSSGEGLIWAVRDPIYSTHQVKSKGRVVDTQEVQSDKGVSDKRILVVESEFVRPLQAMTRKGNTLSAVLRQGWDSGNLASVTKNTPARATGAHVSIIGHITRAELSRNLEETETLNGFVNRFLWVATRRSQLLPLGGQPVDLGPLGHKVALAVDHAQLAQEIGLDPEASALWCQQVYPRLNEPAEGLLGAILARGPAQVRRLALLYALLDFADDVRVEHLLAALALWDYCERSCRWVFSADGTGNADADEILAALKAARALGGMTRNEIYRQVFNTRIPADKLTRCLVLLRDRGLIVEEDACPNGRTVKKFRWIDSKPAPLAPFVPSANGHNELRPNG